MGAEPRNSAGWDHYANAWQVLDENGNELAWRRLAHPHDDEQPFTRSTCDIDIPPTVRRIKGRVTCTAHGCGGRFVEVNLGEAEGDNFEVLSAP